MLTFFYWFIGKKIKVRLNDKGGFLFMSERQAGYKVGDQIIYGEQELLRTFDTKEIIEMHLNLLDIEFKRMNRSHLPFEEYVHSEDGEMFMQIASQLKKFMLIDGEKASQIIMQLLTSYFLKEISRNNLIYKILNADESEL